VDVALLGASPGLRSLILERVDVSAAIPEDAEAVKSLKAWCNAPL